MKTTRIFIAAIFLFTATNVNAQFHLGVKAGLNATKVDGKSFKQAFEYNYLAGAFAEIGLGQRFAIVPEVLFSQTSTTLANGVDGSIFNTEQAKAKLNYLSIPILANVKLAGPLHLELGPQFGAVINSDETILQTGENAFKKGDFSMIGGVQLKFSKIRLSGRYLVGLNNINDAGTPDNWKNQALQASLGIALF